MWTSTTPLVLAALATALAARGTAPRRLAPTGAVEGVVFDSLSQAALAGAVVTLTRDPADSRSSGDTVLVADVHGRFAAPALPAGRYAVRATHALFDSAGLTDGVADTVRVVAGERAAVRLAGPSVATMVARLCPDGVANVGAPAPDRAHIVVLHGVVQDAASGGGRAGVGVQVAWLGRGGGYGTRVGEMTAEARTQAGGRWAVCLRGARTELDGFTVQAVEGSALTAAVRVWAGAGGVRRVDLLAGEPAAVLAGAPATRTSAADTVASAPAAVSTPGRGAATTAPAARPAPVRRLLAGVVRDSGGRPVRGALVALLDPETGDPAYTTDEVRTDTLGGFRAPVRRYGTQLLRVRALGYAPAEVVIGVGARDPSSVDVTVTRVALLAGVEVRGRWGDAMVQRAFADIAHRKGRGLARIADSTAFQRWGDVRTTLDNMGGGLRSVPKGASGHVFVGALGRPVCVLVDGGLATIPPGGIDNIALAEWIADPAHGQPLELQGRCQLPNGRPMGMLIIWTKDFLGVRRSPVAKPSAAPPR